MNLFRSEEDVRAWPDYDPATAAHVLPVVKWAWFFSTQPVVQHRLDADFVEKGEEYMNAGFELLNKLLGQK